MTDREILNDLFQVAKANRNHFKRYLISGFGSIGVPAGSIRDIPGGFAIGDTEFYMVIRSEGGPFEIVIYSNHLILNSLVKDNEGSIIERIYGKFPLDNVCEAVKSLVNAYVSLICDKNMQVTYDEIVNEK